MRESIALNKYRLGRNEKIKHACKRSETDRKRSFLGKGERKYAIKESIDIEQRLLEGLEGEIRMTRGENAVDDDIAC